MDWAQRFTAYTDSLKDIRQQSLADPIDQKCRAIIGEPAPALNGLIGAAMLMAEIGTPAGYKRSAAKAILRAREYRRWYAQWGKDRKPLSATMVGFLKDAEFSRHRATGKAPLPQIVVCG